MKRYLKMMLVGVICVFMSSAAKADDMNTQDENSDQHIMLEHHMFIGDVLFLIKDITITMKEISPDKKIKAKTDDYLKRIDDLFIRHSKMSEGMSGGMEYVGKK